MFMCGAKLIFKTHFNFLANLQKYSAEGYQQEVGDVDDGDDTEEELEPLINGNDESREENEPDDSKVKFVTQDQEPVESRLK